MSHLKALLISNDCIGSLVRMMRPPSSCMHGCHRAQNALVVVRLPHGFIKQDRHLPL